MRIFLSFTLFYSFFHSSSAGGGMGGPPAARPWSLDGHVSAPRASVRESVPLKVASSEVHGSSLSRSRALRRVHPGAVVWDPSISHFNLLGVLSRIHFPLLRGSSNGLDHVSVPLLSFWESSKAPCFDDPFGCAYEGGISASGVSQPHSLRPSLFQGLMPISCHFRQAVQHYLSEWDYFYIT